WSIRWSTAFARPSSRTAGRLARPALPKPRLFRRRFVDVDFPAALFELLRLLRHRGADVGGGQRVVLAFGGVADLLADLHRAEFRSAHRAEMRNLGAIGRERLVVEGLRGFRIERERELVAPAEFEARLAHR